MQAAIVAGVIGAVLLLTAYLVRRARVDNVLASLTRKDHTDEAVQIALAQKQLEDRIIAYNNSRRDLDAIEKSSPASVQRTRTRGLPPGIERR